MDMGILNDVDRFCKRLRPIEDVCYLEHRFNDMLIPLAKEYNILGMPISKEFGGRGADTLTYTKALMRIGMEGSGVRSLFSAHSSLSQKILERYEKEDYLKASVKGDIILAFALTEPDAGSNPKEMKMYYREERDHYILNGVKYLITNATIANAIIVFAKHNDTISAFVIDTDKEGIEREGLSKMGTFTTDTGMFELKDYRVSKSNLIGKEGDGWKIAKEALMDGRLSVAAGCVGSIKDCLIEAISYAKERFQHNKPIAKHQLVQEHIAMIKLHLSTSLAIVFRASKIKSEYEKKKDKESMKRADLAIAEAKLFASNASYDAADRAVQIFGGRGYSFIYRVGRHLIDNRVCRIYEGSDEIMKLKIAEGVLGREYRAF
ncbi:MAG: acyl-CoA dehydrogenase family protein [Candidatus Nitrosocaldaceae archaeon]